MAETCHNTPGMSGEHLTNKTHTTDAEFGMTEAFPLARIIKTDEPEQWCNSLTYLVESMILTTRLSLENDGTVIATDHERIHGAANTLEVALALLAIVNEGTELLQQKAGVGLYARRTVA